MNCDASVWISALHKDLQASAKLPKRRVIIGFPSAVNFSPRVLPAPPCRHSYSAPCPLPSTCALQQTHGSWRQHYKPGLIPLTGLLCEVICNPFSFNWKQISTVWREQCEHWTTIFSGGAHRKRVGAHIFFWKFLFTSTVWASNYFMWPLGLHYKQAIMANVEILQCLE